MEDSGEYMTINEAIKILDYEDYENYHTKEEYPEALRMFWKEMYGTDIQNEDGSYKSMYIILKEAYENSK